MQRFTRLTPRRAAATVFVLAALAACDAPPTAGPPVDDPQELAALVEALGFRGDMVQDFGSYVLVEDDIYITKEQLRRAGKPRSTGPLGPRFQYRTTNLVGSPKVHQITVDLSGLASQAAWQSAARDALVHWSGIASSYVKMVEVSGPADIAVTTTCTSWNVAASASFPSGGNPGNVVYVNTCFGYSTSHAQKVHNMVHELGHTLGFRHSNYTQLGETASTVGAVHIWGTPTSGNASGSVMNGGTALNSWAGFASSDRTATRTLYPLPTPAVSLTYPSGIVLLSWGALPAATHYQVRRMEETRYENYYEGWSFVTPYEGPWVDVYGTSFDTGATWTGASRCTAFYTGYEEQYTDYWYEVRAVFPNGTSAYAAYVGSEDAYC